MVLFQGNRRLLDTIITEDNSTSTTSRIINMYGISSYDDLVDSYLIIKAVEPGGVNATLKVNNLATKSILIYDGSSFSTTSVDWININQLYMVYYDQTGDNFIASPIVNSGGVAPTPVDVPIHLYNADILDLTSSSTAAQILTAFGDNDTMEQFSIDCANGTVIFFIRGDANNNVEITMASELYHIPGDSTNNIPEKVKFTMFNVKTSCYTTYEFSYFYPDITAEPPEVFAFDSVEVVTKQSLPDYVFVSESNTSADLKTLFQQIYEVQKTKNCLLIAKSNDNFDNMLFTINKNSMTNSTATQSQVKYFNTGTVSKNLSNDGITNLEIIRNIITVTVASDTVIDASFSVDSGSFIKVIEPDGSNPTAYMPVNQRDPATKKYVDSKFTDTGWKSCTDLASGAVGSNVLARFKDGVLYFKGRMRSVNTYDPADDVPIDVLQLHNDLVSYVTEEKHFAMLSSTDSVKPLRMMITTTGKIQIEYTDHATGNCNADFDNISLCI